MVTDNNNTWNEWSRHVLIELERLADDYRELTKEIAGLRESIGAMKVKIGVIVAGISLAVSFGFQLAARLLAK
jgi:hypothetical protein